MIELDVHLDLRGLQLRARRHLEHTITGVTGPPRSGKSSLLEVIAGLRRGVRGAVRFEGETWSSSAERVRVPPERRRVGYVAQDELLFPHLDVRGNLLASPHARGVAVDLVSQSLDLSGLLERPVRDLSPGERKRVALGRALAADPRLLLLDEPFAGLDRRRREAARRLVASAGRPTVLVSEDPEDLLALCDEILLVDDGTIIAQGDPGRVLRGRAFDNLSRGVVREAGAGLCVVDLEGEGAPTLRVRGEASVGDAVYVAVGAKEIMLARGVPEDISAQNVLPAEVRKVNRVGDQARVDARVGDLRLDVALTEEARARLGLDEGDAVYLVFQASACRLIRRAR